MYTLVKFKSFIIEPRITCKCRLSDVRSFRQEFHYRVGISFWLLKTMTSPTKILPTNSSLVQSCAEDQWGFKKERKSFPQIFSFSNNKDRTYIDTKLLCLTEWEQGAGFNSTIALVPVLFWIGLTVVPGAGQARDIRTTKGLYVHGKTGPCVNGRKMRQHFSEICY